MRDTRALEAIGRIERALARIDAAAAAAETPRPAADEAELHRLRELHQALRTNVEGAIGEIDRLLASAEAG